MQQTPVYAVVFLLLVAGANCTLAPSHNRRLSQGDYGNIVSGYIGETRFVRRLSTGEFKGNISLSKLAKRDDFYPLYKIITSPRSNGTVLLPTDDSWNVSAGYWCLTAEEAMDSVSIAQETLVKYIKSLFIPNDTITTDQFKEGKKLRSMLYDDTLGDYLTYTLGRKEINGTMYWVLKNASFKHLPGTTDKYEDVVINSDRTDVRAGNAVMHSLRTMTRVPQLESFWRQQKAVKTGDPSLPNGECPKPAPSPPHERGGDATVSKTQMIGIVVGCVGGVVVVVLVVWLALRPRIRLRTKSSLEAALGKPPRGALWGAGRGPHGPRGNNDGCGPQPDGYGGDDGAGGRDQSNSHDDRMISPYYKAASHQPSSGSHGGSTPTAAAAGSTPPGSYGTVVSLNRGSPVRQQPMMQQPSVMQSDLSPFAGCMYDSTGPVAAAAAGMMSVQMASQMASGAAYRSSGGEASASRSSAGSMPPSRKTDSSSSSTGQQSSGADQLGPLRDVRHGLAPAGSSAVPASGMHAGPLVPTESVQPGRISHALIIPFEELALQELIGSGAEGKVYRGTWKHTDIAAKEYLPREPEPGADHYTITGSGLQRTPSDVARAHAQAALAKEVHWLTSLNHPNLVRFCAVCLEPPLVVMEFYKHGSVFALMQKACQEVASSTAAAPKSRYTDYLSWDRRLEMLHDVAAGMSYLHGRDHVHGDLRSPNLFVGADGKVKIGDFGFTKRLACNKASLKVSRITHPRWVAPELIMENKLSRASDVYSFGVIMYELLTFRIPFDDLRKEQVVIEVMQGYRPPIPPEDDLPPGTSSSNCLLAYIRLMEDCWAQDAARRPTFETVARRLKAMRRWRMLISRNAKLQRAASIARSSKSLPAMQASFGRPGSGVNSTLESYVPAPRAGSAPPRVGGAPQAANGSSSSLAGARRSPGQASAAAAAAAAVQQPQAAAAQKRRTTSEQQLGRPVPRHRVSSIPEAESLSEDELPGSLDDLEGADGGAAGPVATPGSLPVSSAVVAATGERLAVIGLPGWQHEDEHDALASVTSAGLNAKRVLLVGSDLPSTFNTKQIQAAPDLPPLSELSIEQPQLLADLHRMSSP